MAIVHRLAPPTLPTIAASQRTEIVRELPYEAVAQDGRLSVLALPPAIGWIWRELIAHHRDSLTLTGSGLIPVLTRLVANTSEAAVRIDHKFTADGGFVLGRSADGKRAYLNFKATLIGQAGTMVPLVGPSGAVPAGELVAEYTYTRLFAAAGERGVSADDVGAQVVVPLLPYEAPSMESAGAVPDGAHSLGDRQRDVAPLVTSMDHTDSNQHINSLVYLRLFIDAAHRRMAATQLAGTLAKAAPRFVRSVEVSYRKPCFAGDALHCEVELFAPAPLPPDQPAEPSLRAIGAAGALYRNDDVKPCAYVRLVMC